jgi:hypothetical protein
MGQDRATSTPAAKRIGRAHRFDLAVLSIEFLECAASEQNRTIPGRPESDLGLPEFLQIECVNALGRRQRVHALQMLIKKRMYFRSRKVIDLDFMAAAGLSAHPSGPAVPHAKLHTLLLTALGPRTARRR